MASPVVNLWKAVLLQVLKDSIKEAYRQEILKYIETNDFTELCILADVPPDRVKAKILQANEVKKL